MVDDLDKKKKLLTTRVCYRYAANQKLLVSAKIQIFQLYTHITQFLVCSVAIVNPSSDKFFFLIQIINHYLLCDDAAAAAAAVTPHAIATAVATDAGTTKLMLLLLMLLLHCDGD